MKVFRRKESAQRLLARDGRFNVERVGVSKRGDLYHALLSATWPRFMGFVLLCYLSANALFALAYFACGADALNGFHHAEGWARLQECFFFSVHTLATIGYGTLSPATLSANLLVTFEALVGMIGLALATGLAFARFSRPTARVIFSRNAIIGQRQGVPSLTFRMANGRFNQIVKAEIELVAAILTTTVEGEQTRTFRDLKLVRKTSPFFALSWTVIHPIDADSPLHGLTAQDLADREIEIFASFMGVDETFAQTIHARYSYSPEEIVWNRYFEDMLSTEGKKIRMDLGRIHDLK
ncbi:MAG: hypothetical protein JST16_08085 [Bdellovibrionales bacterium]|nr:hypothetical protein [Bdellovibrionales bacterium]